MGFRAQLPVVGVVAAGGALGATARYAGILLWPTPAGAFPWTVLTVNAVGCAVLGALMVVATETANPPHPLVRPFLGTGVCGGFTTFSTYALDTQRLLAHGEVPRALSYLAGTAVTALAAAWVGIVAARAATVRRRPT
ncbi:fluoride efflux transporter CrcB [Streptomyces sp. NPDC048623]|uniref:fluoride efflux transporter CrcB n=1 Tax=Streptomyces sp. NPDC048623 TaxID=3155761 RepID=UPI003419D0BB